MRSYSENAARNYGLPKVEEYRKCGFELSEHQSAFLRNMVYIGSYDEEWSLRKFLRRFIWHDIIHAKAMYRMEENKYDLRK